MKTYLLMCFAALALMLQTPAYAADPHGHGADDGHGHAAPAKGHDDHGAAAGDHGDDHGGGHGGLHYWTHDDDHDGIANWRDFENGEQGMTEAPLFRIGVHAVNLFLFCTLLWVFARRPILDALANRALTIKKELTDSAELRDAALARNQELGTRLDKLESEIAGMRASAETDAANDEAKLIERAENEGKRIAEAAERSIRDETQRARFALKRDAVALAVELAESALREQMNTDHHQQLAKDFLDSLKEDAHV